jgi:TfoX/Sxy family transcriptional regulator of competence genes
MQPTLDDLRALLDEATSDLPDVTVRRAFGSFGFYARGAVFALAWRGALRVAVKLPDDASRAALLAEPDTAPWAPRGRAFAGWVVGPARWHDEPDLLRAWVRRAWEQTTSAPVEDALPSMRERLREVKSERARSAKKDTTPAKATKATKPAKASKPTKSSAKRLPRG